ncbi:hypothetical protein EYF80_027127 [Liparis tanakae]|uniref:Uncharacterized protein n=1 Tax=Liparis tanakae TaxID=230148 RepID=A0A4Z2HAA1_9TELE|nr:hypothetical protein EYF80_027127 [Liparis tanakae]
MSPRRLVRILWRKTRSKRLEWRRQPAERRLTPTERASDCGVSRTCSPNSGSNLSDDARREIRGPPREGEEEEKEEEKEGPGAPLAELDGSNHQTQSACSVAAQEGVEHGQLHALLVPPTPRHHRALAVGRVEVVAVTRPPRDDVDRHALRLVGEGHGADDLSAVDVTDEVAVHRPQAQVAASAHWRHRIFVS